MTRYLVIERFLRGARPVYERVREAGRQLPPGVVFIESWVDEDLERCWQLMEADRREQLAPWLEAWSDLVTFEVVPVFDSATAAALALKPSSLQPSDQEGTTAAPDA